MEVKSVTIIDMKGSNILSIEDKNIQFIYGDGVVGVTYDSNTGERRHVIVPLTNISQVIVYE